MSDTGVQVVVPTGQPGRVTPRLTGPRPPAHSHGGRLPRLDRYGWLLAASTLIILMAAVVIVETRPQGRSTVEAGNPTVFAPLDPSASPDYGTLPPDTGVPGDGSPPPTDDPSPTHAPPAAAPGTRPADPTYAAVAGEGCSQTADHGYFRKGFASDWRTRSHGGLTTDGCHGDAVAVPMSGDAHKDDNDNVVVWWFATAPVTGGRCAVSVFVPDTGTASDAAGKPAHYLVFGTANASGKTIGQFDVDQTRNRGRWVDAGRYPADGQLSVRMVTRGVDFGSGRDGAHLGASALRAACTG